MTKVTKKQINVYAQAEVEVRANRAEQLRSTINGKIAIGNVIELMDKKHPHNPKDVQGSKKARLDFIKSYGEHLAELLILTDANGKEALHRVRMTEYRTVAGTPKAQVEACLEENQGIEDVKGLASKLKGYSKKGNKIAPKKRTKMAKTPQTLEQSIEHCFKYLVTNHPTIEVDGKEEASDPINLTTAMIKFLETENGIAMFDRIIDISPNTKTGTEG